MFSGQRVLIFMLLGVGGLCGPAGSLLADVDPATGIDFVTVRAVDNAAYQSTIPGNLANGRGSVGYAYRIGRFEVTTAQWAEFFNAAFDRPVNDRIPHIVAPDTGNWGAVSATPTVQGGRRWRVPAGSEMIPVGDISWRMAAIYCNWLCNNKSTAREAFLSGAYDVSTFGFATPSGGSWTDQAARSPGARYFIPTWDEWLKAAHYDPNKVNSDGSVGGWWQYSTTSDTAPRYGPPGATVTDPNTGAVLGAAQANAGYSAFTFPGSDPFSVPLGAYPAVTSPWGLLDTAGGSAEWTESILGDIDRARRFDGSNRLDDAFAASLSDSVRYVGGEYPHIPTFEFGLRIAAVVPAPGVCAAWAGVFFTLSARRHRR